jgi:hypothetical protein
MRPSFLVAPRDPTYVRPYAAVTAAWISPSYLLNLIKLRSRMHHRKKLGGTWHRFRGRSFLATDRLSEK